MEEEWYGDGDDDDDDDDDETLRRSPMHLTSCGERALSTLWHGSV
jgi:hypothetical protein